MGVRAGWGGAGPRGERRWVRGGATRTRAAPRRMRGGGAGARGGADGGGEGRGGDADQAGGGRRSGRHSS